MVAQDSFIKKGFLITHAMKDSKEEQEKEWKRAAKGIRYRLHPTRKHGKQPDRYYVIRYTVNGQKKQEALGWLSEGWTLDKVQKELSDLKSGLRKGEGPQSLADKRRIAKEQAEKEELLRQEEARKSVTLAEYYEHQYKPWKSLARPVAFEKENSHWRHWLEPQLGSTPMRGIGTEQWYAFVNTLRKSGLSERTVEYVCGTLRRILKHALQKRIITEAPPSAAQIGATAPKDNRRLRVLTQDELTKLLDEIKKRDIYAWRITVFAMLMGCRFSDARRLLWGQVDFERKTVSFVKTKTVARVVPVGDELLTLLKEFGPGAPKERVFLNSKGAPYKEAPHTLKTAVDTLELNEGRAANERFSFHNLRHMAATDLARVLPLRDLMDYMGWKTPSMALRYMHGNEEAQRAAVAAREEKLSGNLMKGVTPEERTE